MKDKEYFWSNCLIEAKKAQRKAKKSGKNNIRIIKIPASINKGHIFPHYAWFDTETETYYDFVKYDVTKQDIFFQGKIKEHSKEAWTHWVRRYRTQILDKFNKCVGMDIGDQWHKGHFDIFLDMEKCQSGKILILRDGNKLEIVDIKDANLKFVGDDDDPNAYAINLITDDLSIIGWRYFNDTLPTRD